MSDNVCEKNQSKKRRQCNKCPWRKDTDPRDIPKGYCEIKHANLRNTIAQPGELNLDNPFRIMACHEFPIGKEMPCAGWLARQLGEGNNILLRLAVIQGRIGANIELVGEQHQTFADTLPNPSRKPPAKPKRQATALPKSQRSG